MTSANKGGYLCGLSEGKGFSGHENKTIKEKIDTEIKAFISLKETIKR